MEILKNIEIKDLALYLKKEKILVIGDLHLGYEQSLIEKGILVPKFYFKDLISRLEKILSKVKVDYIVINGDLKHEFGIISREEWKNSLDLIDFLSKYGKLILVRGNHDTILKPIAELKKLKINDYYKVNDIYICHGHKLPNDIDFASSKLIIVGHEHPAISLREGAKKELYKCFLFGKFKNKKLIVMPSFDLVTEGSDIFKNEVLSPFLKQDLKNFDVYIVADKVYKFGELKNI